MEEPLGTLSQPSIRRTCCGAVIPNGDIRALGTNRGMEVRLVPARGYELDLIPAVPGPRRLNKDLLALPSRMRASIRAVREVMAAQGTQVVVGFGGYVAM